MNSTERYDSLLDYSREKRFSSVSGEVEFLQTLEKNLWKYVPPVLVITGIIGNSLTILVMRR